MGEERTPSAEVRVFFLLFLFLNFLYLVTSSGRVRTMDEVIVDYQAESLVTRGSPAVPQAVAAGMYYGKFDRTGTPQAPYGAGQAVLVAPWELLGRLARRAMPGIPAQAQDIALDAVLTSSSATFAALAGAMVFLLLARLGTRAGVALAASLLIALSTPLFAYSSWFFSEPLAAAILLAAAWALFGIDAETPISLPRASLAGLFLSLALWVRPVHALALPVFPLAILVRERGRGIRAAAAVVAVAGFFGVAYLLRNQALFGSFFDFGYPAAAEGGKRLNSFDTPLAVGLAGFLFSPGKSVLLFAPPLLLAVPGVVRLARRSRGLAVVAGLTPVVYVLFYACYTQWEGGYCFGPRYLLPMIPLLGLGLGPMLEEGGGIVRRLAVILGAAGFLVQIIGMSTSFLEDQASGAYYDEHWNYRMSYDPLVSQSARLLHYLSSGTPAPIGRGFDRWFVFLSKAGVARATIVTGLLFEIACAVLFALRLRSAIRALSRN